MKRLDRYERDILSAYEKGRLVSARPTKAQRGAFREAARAYISGRLQEKRSRLAAGSTAPARKRAR